jgi:hypothetical protein
LRIFKEIDVAQFPAHNHRSFMAKGTAQKKSDGAALAIRGIDANLGPRNVDSFPSDLHSLEIDRPVGRNDLTVRTQLGALSGQFLPSYGIPI